MIDEYEQDFYENVTDADGNSKKMLKQQISKREHSVSGWTYFDTSHGHCGLCGSLACNGRCFK